MESAGEQSVYVLEPQAYTQVAVNDTSCDTEAALPETILIRNIPIFCRFRWIIFASLALLGTVAAIPQAVEVLGLRPHMRWPLVTAVLLLIENLVVLIHYRRLVAAKGQGAVWSLWGQIVADLLILTAVVHYCGSRETVVHMAYVFHIVLACIFFTRRYSLTVTLLACVLYSLCIATEQTGLLPGGGLFKDTTAADAMSSGPLGVLNFLLTLVVMLVVWYLAGLLSAMVRLRDQRLAETNRQLVEAREERRLHMLQTTHELKAPFAAIDANTQLLLKGYCGDLTPETRKTVERIHTRSKRLAHQIQEMLQLANLASRAQQALPETSLDLADVVHGCVEQVQDKASAHTVTVVETLEPVSVTCVEEHLKMLLGNILLNGVLYSHAGGQVRVTCGPSADGRARVTVSDDGIGIPAMKLPRIFDEHYHTTEAVAHNKESTGLGLAIVQRIAARHRLTVSVTSIEGRGTTFEVLFPSANQTTGDS